MRHAFVLSVVLLARTLFAADATSTKAVEATIAAFESSMTAADAKQMAELLTDDFQMIHGTGVVDSREAYLATARAFAGAYPLEDGRALKVKVDEGGIVNHWPNGAVQQGFPGAPNEVALGRGQFLRFTTNGDTVEATYVRENGVAWRAKRAG